MATLHRLSERWLRQEIENNGDKIYNFPTLWVRNDKKERFINWEMTSTRNLAKLWKVKNQNSQNGNLKKKKRKTYDENNCKDFSFQQEEWRKKEKEKDRMMELYNNDIIKTATKSNECRKMFDLRHLRNVYRERRKKENNEMKRQKEKERKRNEMKEKKNRY